MFVACRSERSVGPEPEREAAELTVTASVHSATVATLVVRVSGSDIDPTLVFNLPLVEGIASGVLKIPTGSARTITVVALDDEGLETHRGTKTLDVRAGPNEPVAIRLLPVAGAQPIELWLGSPTVTITHLPTGLRVDESATLAAVVTVNGPGGPVPIAGAVVRWAVVTPERLMIDENGVVTGLLPGQGRVAATYAGVGALADITVDPKLGYYVSPSGAPAGDGSWDSPWDLATALSGGGGRVQPGDIIWLRDGVYVGDFRSTLTGSSEQQVVVRRYTRERATIEGRLRADGAYTTYWGFEIRQADAMATHLPALEAHAPGGKYVNLIIHDAGENGISFRTETGVSEVYGCIVFNNGNDPNLDQGIYAPSDIGVEAKWIRDNVVFNNLASGIQVFADETHPVMRNVHIVGNIAFNNSSIAVDDAVSGVRRGEEENINVGGDNNTVESVTIRQNVLYFSPGISVGSNLTAGMDREPDDPPQRNVSVSITDNFVVGGRTIIRVHEWEQATVTGNTFIAPGSERVVRLSAEIPAGLTGMTWSSNTQFRDPNANAWRFGETLGTWAEFMSATGLGGTDQVTDAAPTMTQVVVRPNAYEPGRAHIAVYNPSGQASVSVPIGGLLNVGDRFEVRNVQDLFGPAVASGTYQGGSITLPMTGVSPPPAQGRGPAPVTGPYFNAFLITRPER